MKITELFLAQLEDEAGRSRRALEKVPTGRDDWKPHDKSMPFGRLAMLVARMPSWFPLIIGQDQLDLAGSNVQQAPLRTPQELVKAIDEGAAQARESFKKATDEFLVTTTWRLAMGGKIVSEQPRYLVVRDTFAHMAHHRGQLTVYLRLNGVPVPALYGPSADDMTFA